jgi:DNA-binding NarL/FixJ family response regulator
MQKATSVSKQESLKILAVSVWLTDRVILEPLCRREGWEVRFTNSPREGFHLASERHFDVILCDSNQAGFPWREVMEQLARNSPDSRILLVSPANDDFVWRDVFQQGGYGVLTRPMREAEVLHAIGAAAGLLIGSGAS